MCSAGPHPSMTGPSFTRVTSCTAPTRSPCASTTTLVSSSPIRMDTAPRDAPDDVVADPALDGEGRHVLARDVDVDVVADLPHPLERDAARILRRPVVRRRGEPAEPAPEADA